MMIYFKRLALLTVTLLATGLGVSAQKFLFTPQWTAQSQFAGYYVAYEQGFYRDAGIDVEIIHPSITESAFERLKSNRSHATTLQLVQAIEMIDSGIPLVNILQTSMNNALVIVSRRNVDPLTQRGEKVGIWAAGFSQVAMCLSAKENIDYEWVPLSSSVNLFVAGALDAALAMSYNEYYQMVQAGMDLNETNTYRFCDHGYNLPEDGVYVTLDFYKKHKDQCKRFAEASRRGWEWAAEHPEETLDIVMDYVQKNHIATNRVLQELMLEEILRLQKDRDSGEREFVLRPEMVEKASHMLYENGFILNEVTYNQICPE